MLNPFEDSSGASLNPFDASFDSEVTPRVSVAMDDSADTDHETRDASLSSSYDNMADNMADDEVEDTLSSLVGSALPQSTVKEMGDSGNGDHLVRSCGSITTLQDVLEDYESVMSGRR